MSTFDKKNEGERKPPLANVIGSKGKGGWIGSAAGFESASMAETARTTQTEITVDNSVST